MRAPFIVQYPGHMTGETGAETPPVDITADLNDQDEAGLPWTFLDEARDPRQIRPGAVVRAGNQAASAMCAVVDLIPAAGGTIVRLRPLPA